MPKVSSSYLEARRRLVLEAAESCFARKGLRATTMQDIADEAGVSYGVLYRYFQSKADLFRAASEEAETAREARFQEAEQEGDSIAVVATALRLSLDRWRDPQASDEVRLRSQVVVEALNDPDLARVVREGLEAYWSRFVALIRDGQARGEIDPGLDAMAVAQLLFALQEGFTGQKAIVPELDVEAYQRLAARVVERALRS